MFWPKKTLVLEFPNHIFLDAKIFFLIAEENTPVHLELTFFCKRTWLAASILFTEWFFVYWSRCREPGHELLGSESQLKSELL